MLLSYSIKLRVWLCSLLSELFCVPACCCAVGTCAPHFCGMLHTRSCHRHLSATLCVRISHMQCDAVQLSCDELHCVYLEVGSGSSLLCAGIWGAVHIDVAIQSNHQWSYCQAIKMPSGQFVCCRYMIVTQCNSTGVVDKKTGISFCVHLQSHRTTAPPPSILTTTLCLQLWRLTHLSFASCVSHSSGIERTLKMLLAVVVSSCCWSGNGSNANCF